MYHLNIPLIHYISWLKPSVTCCLSLPLFRQHENHHHQTPIPNRAVGAYWGRHGLHQQGHERGREESNRYGPVLWSVYLANQEVGLVSRILAFTSAGGHWNPHWCPVPLNDLEIILISIGVYFCQLELQTFIPSFNSSHNFTWQHIQMDIAKFKMIDGFIWL